MRRTPRLPSIGGLLLMTGVVMIFPMLVVGRVQWSDAGAHVDASTQVARSGERLDILLPLAPALAREQLSATWEEATRNSIAQLDPSALQFAGLDFDVSLIDDRIVVDSLLNELGDPEVEAQVEHIRAEIDAGRFDLQGIVTGYEDLISDIWRAADAELLMLGDAAAAAGDTRVARAAEVARAAASVQVVASGQEIRWAQLAARPLFEPTLVEVESFGERLTLYAERSANLESAFIPGSLVEVAWNGYRDDSRTRDLLAVYHTTADELAVEGVPQHSAGPIELDLGAMDFVELLELATELSRVLTASQEVAEGLAVVVNASLGEVEAASRAAVGSATAARSRTLAWIIASTLLISSAAAGVLLLIARPVRRMAQTAEALGRGH
ncbi:MAG: hypothetical protein P8N02_09765, partial [Actinomycetota bacterium]|nr:hypothetical protein [Actinomycetota bacterium]